MRSSLAAAASAVAQASFDRDRPGELGGFENTRTRVSSAARSVPTVIAAKFTVAIALYLILRPWQHPANVSYRRPRGRRLGLAVRRSAWTRPAGEPRTPRPAGGAANAERPRSGEAEPGPGMAQEPVPRPEVHLPARSPRSLGSHSPRHPPARTPKRDNECARSLGSSPAAACCPSLLRRPSRAASGRHLGVLRRLPPRAAPRRVPRRRRRGAPDEEEQAQLVGQHAQPAYLEPRRFVSRAVGNRV